MVGISHCLINLVLLHSCKFLLVQQSRYIEEDEAPGHGTLS